MDAERLIDSYLYKQLRLKSHFSRIKAIKALILQLKL